MPTKHIKRVVALLIGWLLVTLGVVGLLVPLLQGILLLLLGLYVLSRESKAAHRLLQRLKARHPHADARVQQVKCRLRGLWPKPEADGS